MAQNEIEVILARQLASYLAAPTMILDAKGDITYYNEAAEQVLGLRFHETGRLDAHATAKHLTIEDEHGMRMAPETGPLHVAVFEHRPAHRRVVLLIHRKDQRVTVEAQAFPLTGQGNRHVGAMCTFWEVDPA